MSTTVTYLNEQHDVVRPEQAAYAVRTETDAAGDVVAETWYRVTAVTPRPPSGAAGRPWGRVLLALAAALALGLLVGLFTRRNDR